MVSRSVVGGAAGRARLLHGLEDRPILAWPGIECALVVGRGSMRKMWKMRLSVAPSLWTELCALSAAAPSLMFKAS